MDAVDRKILAELQRDGRQTLTELAERVQLTLSPCHRRVRELERNGVITGYRASINTNAVGLGFQTLVFVTMREATRDTISAFEGAVSAIVNVVDAQRLFGEPDYLLRVVAADLDDFQRATRNATPQHNPGYAHRRRRSRSTALSTPWGQAPWELPPHCGSPSSTRRATTGSTSLRRC